jgi:hypothetical protein
MTIIEKDITTVTEGIVAHQVNCLGYMGCGVALAIRKKWPWAYERYIPYGKKTGNGTLRPGMIQMVKVGDRLWVANLAGQDNIGRTKRMTDYAALEVCLQKLAEWMKSREQLGPGPAHFPYGMGCHNAGADWVIVESIIVKYIPEVVFCKGIKD